MHSDIDRLHWLLRLLPARWRPYALLARWDRPIGIWLLLLPGWWALVLATEGWPPLGPMLLFALGAVAMRGAGCTINDMIDRDLDAKVERTRARPLASGALTMRQAMIFLALQLGVGLGVLLQLPPLAIWMGVASLLPVAVYPLMKRVTFWPQLFLGLTFNWGALLGWAAATDALSPAAFLLYAGATAWTLVYDTIYAHQDKTDDMIVGVKSTALLFGAKSREILLGFAALAMIFWVAAGYAAGAGTGFYAAIPAAGGLLLRSVLIWNPDNPEDCLKHFRMSREVGLAVLAAILAGKF